MVWHGTLKYKAEKVCLTDDQWARLEKLAEDREYWKTVAEFMNSVNDRPLSSLTVNQRDWYEDIDAQLSVEIERYEARIAFGLEPEDDD